MTEYCPCLDVVGRVTSDLDEEGDQRATELIWGAIARVLLITEQFLEEWPGFYKMVRNSKSSTVSCVCEYIYFKYLLLGVYKRKTYKT